MKEWDERHPHLKEGSVMLVVINTVFMLLALAEVAILLWTVCTFLCSSQHV